jgi:hypothetical protein
MEIEEGVIWVYGVGEDGLKAFTDFGIESLTELVRMYRERPELLKRGRPNNLIRLAYAGCLRPAQRSRPSSPWGQKPTNDTCVAPALEVPQPSD